MYYFYTIISVILILCGLGTITLGMSGASGAPQEAVIVGLACFLGILARIAQASAHHFDKKGSSTEK